MWIDDKKIDIRALVEENGKITNYAKVPNMKGLGDSTILRCRFENGTEEEIEFALDEFHLLNSL